MTRIGVTKDAILFFVREMPVDLSSFCFCVGVFPNFRSYAYQAFGSLRLGVLLWHLQPTVCLMAPKVVASTSTDVVAESKVDVAQPMNVSPPRRT